MYNWRPMTRRDLPFVSAIAGRVHPDFFEEDAIFSERRSLAPEGCWVCEGDQRPLGYVLSHPWTLQAPPALNTALGALPEDPDSFYIHDLALLPKVRGTGAARRIVDILIDVARPYPTMSLVAVNGSAPFWSRFDFAVANRPDLAQKLETYDPQARLMVRQRT
ncbi:GNAT family N-acetyltransferase [Pelagibacterium limicola]|uniref:GNAT family N-acetyltransferase n=1 Tax=Pelagibacterium limicola TaxID=2791022 RepID=UPI0031B593E0